MAVDVFLGPYRNSKHAFILDCTDPAGKFQQVKCFLGFPSARAAEDCFRRSFGGDHNHHIGGITQMVLTTFKSWLKAGGGRHPVHPSLRIQAGGGDEQRGDAYQEGGAVEQAATAQPTAAAFFGDYLPAAHDLFGGGPGINDLMRHFGGAVSGSSSV
jgi:Inorganic Pyrophosphatase